MLWSIFREMEVRKDWSVQPDFLPAYRWPEWFWENGLKHAMLGHGVTREGLAVTRLMGALAADLVLDLGGFDAESQRIA